MGRPRQDDRATEMRELYDSGKTYAEVGAKYKITASTVQQIFSLRGWSGRKSGPRPKQRKEKG